MRRCLAATMAGLLLVAGAGSARGDRMSRAVAGVDAARVRGDLVDLVALGNRCAISPGFSRATDLVRKLFVAAGLKPDLKPVSLPGATVHNVVADLPGTMRGRRPVMVSAHYDSVSGPCLRGAGGDACPGAEDNASGVAALLAVARALVKAKPAGPVKLVAFAAEELGLVGSLQMTKGLPKTALPAAVINLDMVGHDPHGARRMIVDGYPTGRSLAARLAVAAPLFGPLTATAGIFSEGRSDHRPFADLGVPAVTVASAAWRDYIHYHTPNDDLDQVDPQMVAAVARTALAAALGLTGFADGDPVAITGAFVDADEGDTVTLDGSGSFDPRGKTLSHRWTQVGGPDVTLAADNAGTTFVAADEGTYRFELVVTAAYGRQSPPAVAAAIVKGSGGCSVARPSWSLPILALLVILATRRRRPRA